MLAVIVGMSGSGKTSVCNKLPYERVPTCTDRERRDGEPEDAYIFLDPKKFTKYIEVNAFLEWNTYGEARYGTLRAPVEKAIYDKDTIFTLIIERNGLRALQHAFCVRDCQFLSFWLKVSPADAVRYMRKRGDSDEKIISRLVNAINDDEFTSPSAINFEIVSDDIDRMVGIIEETMECRLTTTRIYNQTNRKL